jgi:hypothetical protein
VERRLLQALLADLEPLDWWGFWPALCNLNVTAERPHWVDSPLAPNKDTYM